MYYPTLSSPEIYRETVDVFGGYNHNLRIESGEFSDMRNLTSDHWPILAPRAPRGVLPDCVDPGGLIDKDSLCYVRGSSFVVNGTAVDMGLSTRAGETVKTLVSMGPYVVIFPDRKYINTANIADFGSLECSRSASSVQLAPCDAEGTVYTVKSVSPTAPGSPANGDYWVDTSSVPHTAKRWSAASGMWVGLTETYVKLTAPGIGTGFREYDGVEISGLTGNQCTDLNGSAVIWAKGEDYLVISGILDEPCSSPGTIRIERTVPEMDFVIESENRLWGCRYGLNRAGTVVNEIYASKLGDFRNWQCYMGTASDSYAVSLGSDGPFTGAVAHMGYPLFFKENCLHKIYGNYPANYRLQSTPCRGVQRGSHGSLAIVGETLLYKSPGGVCAFDGSLPVEISAPLGRERYHSAVAGSIDSKYYISMLADSGESCLFVYDMARHLWHREDDLRVRAFCTCRGDLYALEEATGRVLNLTGGGDADERVPWMAQTGLIGGTTTDAKYLAGLTVRMSLSPGARVHFSLRYDSVGDWENAGDIVSHSLNSFSIPIRPRRCDHVQLRLEGEGDARVFAISRTMEQGSDYF